MGVPLVPLVVGAGLGFIRWRYHCYCNRHIVPTPEIEVLVEQVLEEHSNDDDIVIIPDQRDPPKSRGRVSENRVSFVQKMIDAVFVELGTVKDTEANRLVISKIARDEMKKQNVRNCDIRRNVPLIVELYFVPTISEFEGKMARFTRATISNMKRLACIALRLSFTRWLFWWKKTTHISD
jgi:hypothetical protein